MSRSHASDIITSVALCICVFALKHWLSYMLCTTSAASHPSHYPGGQTTRAVIVTALMHNNVSSDGLSLLAHLSVCLAIKEACVD